MRAHSTPIAFFLAVIFSVVAGCSDNDPAPITTTPPDPDVTISVAPKAGSVPLGGTMTFGATVANATNTKVEWAVFSTAPAFGYISQTGLYTAPSTIEQDSILVYVEATASANGERADTAVIVVKR
jgi:hypothetical protein